MTGNAFVILPLKQRFLLAFLSVSKLDFYDPLIIIQTQMFSRFAFKLVKLF